MAQAYFNFRIEKCSNPSCSDSAGIAAFTGQPVSIEALETMKELYGIDLSEHRSKPVTAALMEQADLVLAMTKVHERILLEAFPACSDKIFTLPEYAGGLLTEKTQDVSHPEIQDPYGRGMSAYKAAVKNITDLVDKVIEHICEMN